MGRHPKTGLYYFPKDVDYWDDFRIMDLMNKYGPLGAVIYDIVISKVYKNGYYLEVPLEKLASQIIRLIGNRWIKNKSLVQQVILYCADIGLFDHALLSQSVITSAEIQRRYSEVTVRNKVNKEKYWLLENNGSQAACESVPSENISVAEKAVNAAEIPVNAASMQQSKVKKSKEKKSKVNESKVCILELPCRDGSFIVDKELFDIYTHTYPNMIIELSLKQLRNYLCTNPEKQKYTSNIREQIDWWLSGDEERGKHRKNEELSGFPATFDINEYESTSIVDEEY